MRNTYGERDYASGAALLTLRTAIGLTQEGLAKLLGVSRRAVGDWEAGSNYPKADHLKRVIALAVKNRAFPEGREAEAIRKLWKAAHQRVLIDEHWLIELLEQSCFPESAERSNWSGKPTVKTQVQGEAEERKGLKVIPMYPTGWGRFALGSPSGSVLYPGQSIEILLSGHRIAGVIHAGGLGDYFQASDGMSCCGLYPGMCVVACAASGELTPSRHSRDPDGDWRKNDPELADLVTRLEAKGPDPAFRASLLSRLQVLTMGQDLLRSTLPLDSHRIASYLVTLDAALVACGGEAHLLALQEELARLVEAMPEQQTSLQEELALYAKAMPTQHRYSKATAFESVLPDLDRAGQGLLTVAPQPEALFRFLGLLSLALTSVGDQSHLDRLRGALEQVRARLGERSAAHTRMRI